MDKYRYIDKVKAYRQFALEFSDFSPKFYLCVT